MPKSIPLYINVILSKIVKSVDYYNAYPNSKPSFYLGESFYFDITLLNNDGTYLLVNDTDTFELAIDNDYLHTDALQVYSSASKFEILDKAKGLIRCSVNANTEALKTEIGSNKYITSIIELKRYNNDGSFDVLLNDFVDIKNLVKDNESEPVINDPLYYTSSQIDNYLVNKSNINHNHDSNYSAINHAHNDVYALINHTHDYSTVFSAINHNHNSSYSLLNHTHDYSSVFSAINHTHTSSNISDLTAYISNHSDVSANTSARHNHANLSTINAINALPNDSTLYLKGDGTWGAISSSAGGDVSSSTVSIDLNLACFDGVTGKIIKDSGYSVSSFASNTHTHDYSSNFANLNHNHDSSYSALNHTHSTYITNTQSIINSLIFG